MTKDQSREERLAAQLRANLRKRKSQAKGMAARDDDSAASDSSDLSKGAPES